MQPKDQLIKQVIQVRGDKIDVCVNVPSPLTGQSSLISLQRTWQHALEKPVEL